MICYKIGDVFRPMCRRSTISADVVCIVEKGYCDKYWRVLGIRADGHFTGIHSVEQERLLNEYQLLGNWIYMEDMINTARKVKERFKPKGE